MDPNYDIKRDYSKSASQAFTHFATTLIQRGQLIALLGGLASEELEPGVTRLQGLPSWAPDLRSKVLRFSYRSSPVVAATVSSDTFLICDVRCVGRIERVENELFDSICEEHDTLVQVLHPSGLLSEYKLHGLSRTMQRARPEDLLCSLQFESPRDLE